MSRTAVAVAVVVAASSCGTADRPASSSSSSPAPCTESTGTLRIDSFEPGIVRVKEFVVLRGQGMAFPWTGNLVLFDGAPADTDWGTSAMLRVRVPEGLGVPEAGRRVAVEVLNMDALERTCVRALMVLPAVVPQPAPRVDQPRSVRLVFTTAADQATVTFEGSNLAGTDGPPLLEMRAASVAPTPARSFWAASATQTQTSYVLHGSYFDVGTAAYRLALRVGPLESNSVRLDVVRAP